MFAIYILYAFLFGLSYLVLLEIIQQIEQGKKPRFFRAVFDSIILDSRKVIPILLVWAAIWLLLVFLEVLFSKKKDKDNSPDFTAKAAVGTLLGADQKLSLSAAFFKALSKGVRMTVFLIFSAVAWEDLPPVAAVKKGLQTIRNTKGQFMVAYGLTELFAIVALLVPTIIYMLDDKLSLQLPSLFWCILLIYIAFATSLIFLMEQLYTAQLYMWHQNWERVCNERREAGQTAPSFSDSCQPELFKPFFDVSLQNTPESIKLHK